jgi:PEP-CTERM motif
LDLQGNISVPGSMTMNPGASGLIKLDGASFSHTGVGTGSINTSAFVTAGTFDVVAATSFTSVAFSAGTAASFSIDAPLNLVDAASSVSAKNVSLNGQTVSGLGTLTGTTAINSTGTSTLAAPFAGAALNVSSGTLDIKSAGTSTGKSTVSTTLNIDNGASWTAGTVTNNGTVNDAGGWTTSSVTNNSTINVNVGGKWTLPNALSALTNNGTVNLNGGTIQGPTGPSFNNAGMFGAGAFNVTANSTLAGNLGWNSNGNTFNIGAFTLNLDTSNLATVSGTPPFIIAAGGTLNNANGASSMGGGGTVTLNGGSITNTSGSPGTTAGLFKIGDAISGYGLISGNVDIASTVTAAGSGKTLTVDGGSGSGLQLGNSSGSGASMGTSGGATLDLKGNLSLIEPASANPGTGTIQFDGAHFTNAFSSSPVAINNSGSATTGTFDVVNASTLNNVAFSTGNGANLKVDAPLTASGGATVDATSVTVNSGGALNLLNTTGTTTLTTKNLTLANGSTLNVGAGHNAISLTGNFSYQQTDTINGWTNGGTPGLGPNLVMTGGSSSSPTTLEAGSVNKGGYNPAAWDQNFALSSLTLGSGAYDKLVDNFQNATPSGWTSGSEVLYLDGLFGVTPGSGNVIPTLNLMGIEAFLLTQVGNGGFLYNGLYTDANGGEINIIGASPAPEPAALLLFGSGLAGLALVRRRRRN